MENDLKIKINNTKKLKYVKQLIWLGILRNEKIITNQEYLKVKFELESKYKIRR